MHSSLREAAISEFTFELCAKCVGVLDRAVTRSKIYEREIAAMEAGKRIRSGSREIDDLLMIAEWKAPRSAHHLKSNKSSELLSEVLNVATAECGLTGKKVDELVKLVGVRIPMASAILTCINPASYTVIDVKVLDALHAKQRTITRDLYIRYLTFCRSTAKEIGVELRQLDRALWKSGSIV